MIAQRAEPCVRCGDLRISIANELEAEFETRILDGWRGGFPRADKAENASSGFLDLLQALGQQPGVALVELDVVLRCRASLKARLLGRRRRLRLRLRFHGCGEGLLSILNGVARNSATLTARSRGTHRVPSLPQYEGYKKERCDRIGPRFLKDCIGQQSGESDP